MKDEITGAWLGRRHHMVSTMVKELCSHAEDKGRLDAKRNPSVEKAAFLVNLDKPTENPQHRDLQAVEDYLHGYYGELLRQKDEQITGLSNTKDYWIGRAEAAEKSLYEYQNSKAGSVGDKRAAKANSGRARRNPRRN